MGQLEKYGLYVLCLVIFLILGVTLWGGGDAAPPARKQEAQTPMRASNPVAPPATPNPALEPKAVDISGLLQPESRGDEPKKAPLVEAPKAADKPADPRGAASEATKSAEVAVEAKPSTYKVQTGDTFESIARTKLGDAKRHPEIAKLNPTVKANRLRVGQELVLPGAKPAAKASEAIGKDAKKTATATEAVGKGAGSERWYVVGKGDNFGRIAQTQLGSSKRVDEIRELNPTVDPTRLRPGQRIQLPKK